MLSLGCVTLYLYLYIVSVHCIVVSEEEKAVEGILQGHSQAGAVAQH